MKHSREGGWLPLLVSESEGDSDSPARRSWKDSTTYSVIPTNSSFVWDGGARRVTGWPTVSAVLRRPDESTIGTLQMRYSGERGSPLASCAMTLANEKVRWRRSSRDGWGPRKVSS